MEYEQKMIEARAFETEYLTVKSRGKPCQHVPPRRGRGFCRFADAVKQRQFKQKDNMNKKIDRKEWIPIKEAAEMLGNKADTYAAKWRNRAKYFARREIRIKRLPYFWYAYLPDVKRALKRWGSNADARTTAFDRDAKKS